jgi:hypothetical protein
MHQWKNEFRKLGLHQSEPKCLTTIKDFFGQQDFWGSWPQPDQAEWWLISHGFRAPRVRSNSDPWRAAVLPSLVDLYLAPPAKRRDARTRLGKLHREANEEPVNSPMALIAKDVAPRVRTFKSLRGRIKALPLYRGRQMSNDDLLSAFTGDSEARLVIEEILGLWLGDFHLIVIDEAHKSRGEIAASDSQLGSADGKVLARLVDKILKQSTDGRRLCLTATPMELELEQWNELLARARSVIGPEFARGVVRQFHHAAQQAAVAPDERGRIQSLCDAARKFQQAFSPYVSRRRRVDDSLVTVFSKAVGRTGGCAHPHRNVEPLKVPADNIDASWMNVLFAAECMSQSLRGLPREAIYSLPGAVSNAYRMLSAGHLSMDLIDTNDPEAFVRTRDFDETVNAKIARTEYWYGRLLAAHQDATACEHPRILAAVKEIEKWTSEGEKVLVFGVFLEPLRRLRDVLNVRQALRVVDQGHPLAFSVRKDLRGVVKSQLEQLRDSLSGQLANEGCAWNALRQSHRQYESLRRHIQQSANKRYSLWFAGTSLAKADRELKKAILRHLITYLLDDQLAHDVGSSDLSQPAIDSLAEAFYREQIHPLLVDPEEAEAGDAAQLSSGLNRLQRAFVEDVENDSRQSPHVRLLQGSTRWETRQYLQAAFNRRRASPQVLIAQSQVGREGLNFHESCRVVVQFHAEWNPAVLEQQIGRVDRKGSHWEKLAQQWLQDGETSPNPPPFIEVRQLVLEGTYDALQWGRVMRRQQVFNASLFGTLLPAESWERVPEPQRRKLIDAAPCFRPDRKSQH